MSAKTNLPTFFTFMILLFSEHFLGIWGLIIGIPIFIFLLDMLDIEEKNNKIANEYKTVIPLIWELFFCYFNIFNL